jgi:hypothetical protein
MTPGAPAMMSAMAVDPSSVVARQVEAYNAHDLEAFLACYAPDAGVIDRVVFLG